jgi:hypothetical protein
MAKQSINMGKIIDNYYSSFKLSDDTNDNVNVGAYGWLHPHWLGGFYHEDMPEEWQLNYYSNEFNCVLVPADYWHAEHGYDCDSWLDDVHENFVFYLELPATLLTDRAKKQFLQQVTLLQPKLAGIVVNEQARQPWLQKLAAVSPLYRMDVSNFDDKNLTDENLLLAAGLAILPDDLSDLRQCRQTLSDYFDVIKSESVAQPYSLIVVHPQLSVTRLAQLRSVIEIMGL